MRSARMALATATATAALAIAAPVAYAGSTGEWDHDDSSYSKEHDKDGSHDSPRGGMHTGGGALTMVNEDDWGTAKDPKHDPETYKDKDKDGDHGSGEDSWSGKEDKEPWDSEHDKDSWSGEHDKDSWKSEHDKPHGGMHTGGGALAEPGVTAGGLAVLAMAGTGVYALQRRKASEGVA